MDLIDRQSAIDALHGYFDGMLETDTWSPCDVYGLIEILPSADIDMSDFSDKLWRAAYERSKAEPVRHGHWIYTPTNILGYVCSECGKAMCRFDYCPHCGARMGEVE